MDPITLKYFKRRLFEKVCISALVTQAKADTDNDRAMCPEKDKEADASSRALIEHLTAEEDR